MKKLMLILSIAIFALGTNAVKADSPEIKPLSSSTVSTPSGTTVENKLSDREVRSMIDRLKEIRRMDKSNLTKEQKHELRNEVLAIRDRLRKHEVTYVYVSGGALILILILLIILL